MQRNSLADRIPQAQWRTFVRDWRFAASRRVARDVPSLARWYVVAVHSGREIEVAKEMETAGLDVFLPMRKEQRKVRNRRGGKRKQVRTVECARWPGYLFVRCIPTPKAFYGVVSFDHVIEILAGSDGPLAFSDSLIDGLVRELEGRAVDLSTGNNLFSPGQNVEITNGAFHYFKGQIAANYCGGADVTVLLEFMGTTRKVKTDVDSLTAID